MSQQTNGSCLNLLKSLEEQDIKIPMADQQDLGLDVSRYVGLDLGLTLGRSYNPSTSVLCSQPKATQAGDTSHVKRHANNREGKRVVLKSANPAHYPPDVACSNRTTHTYCTCHDQGVNARKMPTVSCGMQNQGPPYILESSYVAQEAKASQACVGADVAMGRHPGKLPMIRVSENTQDKAEVMGQRSFVTTKGPTRKA